MSDTQTLVRKLWNYCDILRDNGLSYGDYVEQLTYLLFLKMADEQADHFAHAEAYALLAAKRASGGVLHVIL